MDLSSVGIISLIITGVLGLLIKTAYKKIAESADRSELLSTEKNIVAKIEKVSTERESSSKEIWIEIRNMQKEIAEMKGRMEK